jgi:hypothetical protein
MWTSFMTGGRYLTTLMVRQQSANANVVSYNADWVRPDCFLKGYFGSTPTAERAIEADATRAPIICESA